MIKPYQTKFNILLSGATSLQISFDPINFYQIITNILQNAMDASQSQSPITITISDKKGQVQIEIQDNGCGIEEEDIPKIFEPYFSKKKKGIGLGMALVKKLVDINDAKIFVESEIGIGTKFVLIMEKS